MHSVLTPPGAGRSPCASEVENFPRFSPRDYQSDTLRAIQKAKLRGVLRQAVELPTGSGKAVILALLAQNYARVLILVNRDELIRQAVDKLRMVNPDADIGVVQADRNELGHRFTVASVQTVARLRRLRQLGSGYDLVIVDECHHSPAASYRRVLAALGCFGGDPPLLVGFSATLDRADGEGLDTIFQEITYSRSILEMIEQGWLSDLRALRVRLAVDYNDLRTRAGDIAENEAAALLEEAGAPEHLARAYLDHARGRKAIVFVPGVKLAHATAGSFRAEGVAAEAVDGAMPMKERRAVLERFARNETRVLVNAMLLIEGYDQPDVDCVIIARPTKSRGLYCQMVGRATRTAPGKADALIIDVTGATERLDLVTLPSLLGMPDERLVTRTVGELIAEQQAEREAAAEQEARRGELIAYRVQLFRQRQAAWTHTADGKFVLPAGRGYIVLRETGDTWAVLLVRRDLPTQVIRSGLDFTWAVGVAEDTAKAMGAGRLLDPSEPWRSEPATEKQLALLRLKGIPVHEGMTKGEASAAITAAIASEVA